MIRQRNHGHTGGRDGIGNQRMQPSTPWTARKDMVQYKLCAQNIRLKHSLRSCCTQRTGKIASNLCYNSLDGHPKFPGDGVPTSSSTCRTPVRQPRRCHRPAQIFARGQAFVAFLVLVGSAVVHPARAADPTTDYLKPSVSSKVWNI